MNLNQSIFFLIYLLLLGFGVYLNCCMGDRFPFITCPLYGVCTFYLTSFNSPKAIKEFRKITRDYFSLAASAYTVASSKNICSVKFIASSFFLPVSLYGLDMMFIGAWHFSIWSASQHAKALGCTRTR